VFQFDGTTRADWRTRTWRFTAKEATTTLEFAATSDPATGVGVAIDNVIVLDPNGPGPGDQRILRVSATPGGSVEVRSESTGTVDVHGGASQTFPFDYETDVTLVAQPATGYMFGGWTGLMPTDIVEGSTDSNAVTVRVSHAMALEAEFKNLVVKITDVNTANCAWIEATAMVTDIKDTPVLGLNESNFALYEDGIRQEPISVRLREPIAVALCLDFSGSMGDEGDPNEPLQQMKDSAKQFVGLMIDKYDLGEIIKFALCYERTQEFTTDKTKLRDAIDPNISCSRESTRLFDAIWHGVGDVAEQRVSAKAVVVITDGQDRGSEHSKEDVIQLAESDNTNIPVYTIGLGKEVDEQVLKDIAAATGGLYSYDPNGEDLAEIFQKISELLLGQYIVSYETAGCASTGGTHELKIEVNVDDRSDLDTRPFTCPDVCLQP
jgi:VWFA-related protein